MQEILQTLAERYDPLALIVYGSFAEGSDTLFSDFDALVITREGEKRHDCSFVHGVQLDVFVCPRAALENDFKPEDYVQIYDGKILLDDHGLAEGLIQKVNAWLDSQAAKSREELSADVSWCEKMLRRAGNSDAEGAFRRHWLLVESLEIYTALRGWRYLGPKKALRQLQTRDKNAYRLYAEALADTDPEALAAWVEQIKARRPKGGKGN